MVKYTWLTICRFSMGWLFLYAGASKLLTPGWSAFFYIKDATTFRGFYSALGNADILPLVNWLVMLGLTLIGVSLLLGVLLRASTILGAIMMLLLYFPVLNFPYPNPNSYIVDHHIVYAVVLMVLYETREYQKFSLAGVLNKRKIFSRHPKLAAWLY